MVDAGKCAQQSRLARPIVPEQGNAAAAFQFEVDPIQRPHHNATANLRGIDPPAHGRPKQRAPPRPGGRLINGEIHIDLIELDVGHGAEC